MIKLKNFPIKTLKSLPKISENKSTSILLQTGFIRQTMAGVYNFTTFGLKILRKIENIVRDEMNNVGASEILLSSLSPMDIWEKTGRENIEEYFKTPTYGDKFYRLNPTHEEVVVPLMKEFVNSYKDSGACVYQIQTKFRNEKRAKSGLLRGREFLMKDAYSFHSSNEDFEKYYEKMKKAYKNIFDRLGIGEKTFITLADGGNFTEKFSHEFQTILEIGEDDIFICKKCKTSHNKEIISEKFICTNCKNEECETFKACEIGNIFPLETKFSKPFGMKVLDENNKEKDVIMGCYGIGVSRLMGVIAEFFLKDDKILWPENLVPADYYFVILCEEDQEKALEFAEKLEKEGKEVIFDDRFGKKFGFGQKVFDAELYGIPNIVVFSKKTLEKGGYEMKKRGGEFEFFKV